MLATIMIRVLFLCTQNLSQGSLVQWQAASLFYPMCQLDFGAPRRAPPPGSHSLLAHWHFLWEADKGCHVKLIREEKFLAYVNGWTGAISHQQQFWEQTGSFSIKSPQGKMQHFTPWRFHCFPFPPTSTSRHLCMIGQRHLRFQGFLCRVCKGSLGVGREGGGSNQLARRDKHILIPLLACKVAAL